MVIGSEKGEEKHTVCHWADERHHTRTSIHPACYLGQSLFLLSFQMLPYRIVLMSKEIHYTTLEHSTRCAQSVGPRFGAEWRLWRFSGTEGPPAPRQQTRQNWVLHTGCGLDTDKGPSGSTPEESLCMDGWMDGWCIGDSRVDPW